MMRLSLLVACVLCGAAVGTPAASAAPASTQVQRAGGFVVRWPSAAALRAVQPSGRVEVVLVPSRQARALRRVAVVSLVRVSRGGALLSVVTRRRMRAGRFAARVPARENARYRLAVAIGSARVHRDFDVTAAESCSAASVVSATLSATPAQARPGQTLDLALTNTAATCLHVGYDVSWQIYRDGTWVEIPLDRAVILLLASVAPGQTFRHDFAVPQDSSPGQYRVVKHISGSGPRVDVAAAVTVVA
jgi:hypothetical protein